MCARGVIKYRKRSQQVKNFLGLRWGKITPTDLDFFIDFGGEAFILGELKLAGAAMPRGQELAIERAVDAWAAAGHSSLGIVAEHNTPLGQDIDVAACRPVAYRYNRQWTTEIIDATVRQIIDRFLEYQGIKI